MELVTIGGLALILILFRGWTRQQGAAADAAIESGDMGGCMGRSLGVLLVGGLLFAAFMAAAAGMIGGAP